FMSPAAGRPRPRREVPGELDAKPGTSSLMRVVVVGATGNVGTSVLESLAPESRIEEIVAVARRAPGREFPRTRFEPADIASSDLGPILRGADVVVHLAWLIQPG